MISHRQAKMVCLWRETGRDAFGVQKLRGREIRDIDIRDKRQRHKTRGRVVVENPDDFLVPRTNFHQSLMFPFSLSCHCEPSVKCA